jgi:MFS family permease
VPRVLSASLVPSANTLSFTASNLGMVVGPLLAGLLLARWSFAAAYATDLAIFTVALYAALRLPALPPTGPATAPGLRSVIDGLAFIATRPVLLLSFAVDIVAMVLAMPRALFPETAAGLGSRGAVGWLYAAIAIGAVLAGLSSGWIGRVGRQGVALVVAVIVWGLAVAAAGLAQSLWLIVAMLAVAGAGACRGCSSWSWPAARGSATCGPGRWRPPSGSPWPGSAVPWPPPPWSAWPCWCRPCAGMTPTPPSRQGPTPWPPGRKNRPR